MDDEGDGQTSEPNDPTISSQSMAESPSSPHRLTLAKQRQQCKQFCSQLISVRQFQSNYLEVIDNDDLDRNLLDVDVYDMADEMNIPVETVQELSQICSVHQLKGLAEEEISLEDASPDNLPEGVELEAMKHESEQIKKKKRSKNINYLTTKNQPRTRLNDTSPCDIDEGEVLLIVNIYHPIKLLKSQEYSVIGSQFLSELRDKIECFSDEVVTTECSSNLDMLESEPRAVDISRSAFFFIENVFYNDLRGPLCKDYSKIIIDWTKKQNDWMDKSLGPITSKLMTDVKFIDLKIRLGYPYLFCHQGDCEHLIIFQDLRFLSEGDIQCRSAYPVSLFKNRPRRQLCRICDMFIAKWITYNDRLASAEPSYFCDKCFRSLHYHEDGSKICDFEAYAYVDDYI